MRKLSICLLVLLLVACGAPGGSTANEPSSAPAPAPPVRTAAGPQETVTLRSR